MQKSLLTNKGTYIMEPEQTRVRKTAAVHVTMVQKLLCALLRSIRKVNGLQASHNSKCGLPLWVGADEAPH